METMTKPATFTPGTPHVREVHDGIWACPPSRREWETRKSRVVSNHQAATDEVNRLRSLARSTSSRVGPEQLSDAEQALDRNNEALAAVGEYDPAARRDCLAQYAAHAPRLNAEYQALVTERRHLQFLQKNGALSPDMLGRLRELQGLEDIYGEVTAELRFVAEEMRDNLLPDRFNSRRGAVEAACSALASLAQTDLPEHYKARLAELAHDLQATRAKLNHRVESVTWGELLTRVDESGSAEPVDTETDIDSKASKGSRRIKK